MEILHTSFRRKKLRDYGRGLLVFDMEERIRVIRLSLSQFVFVHRTEPSNAPTRSKIKYKRALHRRSGQALVESVVGLILLVAIFIALFAGLLDVFDYMTYSEKVRMAALSTARSYAARRSLYNTMLIPDPAGNLRAQAREKAIEVGNHVCDL